MEENLAKPKFQRYFHSNFAFLYRYNHTDIHAQIGGCKPFQFHLIYTSSKKFETSNLKTIAVYRPNRFLNLIYNEWHIMVRLYIIRHADPDYDTDRENGGSLTDHGRLEAVALGKFLKEQKITHAYSSPMGRARLTAELALRDELPEILADLKVENWTKELSSWRQVSSIAGNEPASALVSADDRVGEGSSTVTTKKKKKSRAVWDIPGIF